MIEFNVIVPNNEDGITKTGELLKKVFNFEIFDLRETDILRVKDNSKVYEVAIICCRGELESYEMFKKLCKRQEIEYEGRPTLM